MASVNPAGEVIVHGKDGSEEAQEVEGGTGRCRSRSRCVGGGSEALDLIRGGGIDEYIELHPNIHPGEGWGR